MMLTENGAIRHMFDGEIFPYTEY